MLWKSSLDHHHAAHNAPVSGEGADKGITAGVPGDGESNLRGLAAIDQRRGPKHLGDFRDKVFFHGPRLDEHGIGGGANCVQRTNLPDDQVVDDVVGVLKGQPVLLA